MAMSETIFDEIIKECARAGKMWGSDFDDNNTLNDWITYVVMYLGKAAYHGATPNEVHKNLIKAAGLLISAIGTELDNEGFAPRHYDGQSRPKSMPEITR